MHRVLYVLLGPAGPAWFRLVLLGAFSDTHRNEPLDRPVWCRAGSWLETEETCVSSPQSAATLRPESLECNTRITHATTSTGHAADRGPVLQRDFTADVSGQWVSTTKCRAPLCQAALAKFDPLGTRWLPINPRGFVHSSSTVLSRSTHYLHFVNCAIAPKKAYAQVRSAGSGCGRFRGGIEGQVV
jgi:hypothetical protein